MIRGLSLAYSRFFCVIVFIHDTTELKVICFSHTVLPRYSRFHYSRYFYRTYLPRITRETCICFYRKGKVVEKEKKVVSFFSSRTCRERHRSPRAVRQHAQHDEWRPRLRQGRSGRTILPGQHGHHERANVSKFRC